LHEEFLYFQGQTTNACAFLLINGFLNEDKELNLTTNHRPPRAKRFANYALKTGMEGVLKHRLSLTTINAMFKSIKHRCIEIPPKKSASC
jgi:hypothetical protein